MTPEQLREEANNPSSLYPAQVAKRLRAHADALEELAALRAQLADPKKWEAEVISIAQKQIAEAGLRAVRAEAQLASLKAPVEVAGIVARVNMRRGTDQMRKLRGERPQDDPWPWIHEGELLAALESLAAQLAERDAELAAKREVVEMVDDICELVGVPKDRWHGCYQAVAALKGHAEAMAHFIEWQVDGMAHDRSELDAYRAAYPKEADKP